MALFSLLKRSKPSPAPASVLDTPVVRELPAPKPEVPEPADLSADELLQLLFDTLSEGDSDLLEARCRDHKSMIAEHLPTWLIVPDSLSSNPAATRWYRRGVKHFARVCQNIS